MKLRGVNFLDTSPGWSTPNKKHCRSKFSSYYETGQWPSTIELLEFLKMAEIKNMTLPKLRSHLQHDIKYLKKRQSI